MNLQDIINAADVLVPNVIPIEEKVEQLNDIDREFYNNVKVPTNYFFNFEKGLNEYELAGAKLKSKDIEFVEVGMFIYKNGFNTSSFRTSNLFDFNDENNILTLHPPPPFRGSARIVYYKNSFSEYSADDLTQQLDIPTEFHQTIIPALASWIAFTQDDITKATVYEAQYRSDWNLAAQNYGGS